MPKFFSQIPAQPSITLFVVSNTWF